MGMKKKCSSRSPAKRKPRRSSTTSTSKRRSYIYPVGTLVEVRSNDLGFHGAWYEATITDIPSKGCRLYRITYSTLVTNLRSNTPLQESVYGRCIRPRPPVRNPNNNDLNAYEIYEQVEAFHDDGWWPGVVNRLPTNDNGGEYSVYFPSSREEFLFQGSELRKKLEWVKGNWVSVRDLLDYSHDREGVHVMFSEGTQVEVSRDRNNYGAAWFVGTVKKVIGRTSFLVEYENLLMDNDDSCPEKPPIIEIVDLQYIRPCPPALDSSAVSFNLLDVVEVFVEGAWFVGMISNIFSKSRYMVKYKYKDDETVVLNCNFLRPCHVWTDEQWVLVSQDNNKKGTDGSASATKKRKKAMRSINLESKVQSTPPCKKSKKGVSQEDHSAKANSHLQLRSCKKPNLLIPAIRFEDNLSPQRRNSIADDRGERTQIHTLPLRKALANDQNVLNLCELSSNYMVTKNSIGDGRGEETKTHAIPVTRDLDNSRNVLDPCELSSNSVFVTGNVIADDRCEETQTRTLPVMNDLVDGHNVLDPCELSLNIEVLAGNTITNDRGEDFEAHILPVMKDVAKYRDKETEDHTLPIMEDLINGHNVLHQRDLSSNYVVVEGKSIADDRGQEDHSYTPLIMKDLVNGHNVLNPCELSSYSMFKRQGTHIDPNISRLSLSNVNISLCGENGTWEDDASNKIPSPLTIKPALMLRELAESATEILGLFPQQPHFHPLLQYNRELRVGLESGYMMAFASIVRSIKDLRIVDSEQEFEDKLKALDRLETHGFNIKGIRDRIEKLLEARRVLSQFERSLNSVEELKELEEEKGRNNLLLSEIDDRVAELEVSIAQLKEKRTSIITEIKMHESKIADLKEIVRADEEKRVNAELHFNDLLTAPW